MHRFLCWSLTALALAGCSLVRPPSADELRAVQQPSPENAAWADALAPRAAAWLTQQETRLFPRGRPLSAAETDLARRMGVQHPEQVRVLILTEFPVPSDPALARDARSFGYGSPQEGGRTMGYLILVKPRYVDESWLLAHELVHVGQQERLGSAAFIRRYLLELRVLGYRRSPLELEANHLMRQAAAPSSGGG